MASPPNQKYRCKICGSRVCTVGMHRLCGDPECAATQAQISEAHAGDRTLKAMHRAKATGDRAYDSDRPDPLPAPVLYGLLTRADCTELSRRREKFEARRTRAA